MTGKNKIKYLILTLVLIFLIVPRPAAADFVGIMDYFTQVGTNLKNAGGPLLVIEYFILFAHLISVIFLIISSAYLDFVLDNSPAWLTVNNNAMVQAGWQFTAGLANLFIVLALIVLAFGFILKIESWEARKTLPRLIIVALLLNFSLVFIGALIDISNILYKTIHDVGGANLIAKTVAPLASTIWGLFFEGVYILLLNIALSLTGPAGTITMVGKYILLLTKWAYLPTAVSWLINAFFGYVLAGIFVVFTFLMSARVLIIQMLAIVSPLIFLCWAFAPLKKYWDEWLSHLLEWLFFGLILYFFMVIGMKMANFLMPGALTQISANMPGLAIIGIPLMIKYYTFLFIYLVVIIYFGRRLTPNIGRDLVTYGAAWGATLAVAGKVMIAGLNYETKNAAIGERQKRETKGRALYEEMITTTSDEKEKEELREAMEKNDWSKLDNERKKQLEGGRLAKMKYNMLVKPYEYSALLQGKTIMEDRRKEQAEIEEEAKKTLDPDMLDTKAQMNELRGRSDLAGIYRDMRIIRNLGYKGQAGMAKKEEADIAALAENYVKKEGLSEEAAREKAEKEGGTITKDIRALMDSGNTSAAALLSRAAPAAHHRVLGDMKEGPEKEYYKKFVANLTDDEKKRITEKYKISDEKSEEFLIRTAQLVDKTDDSEVGAWDKDIVPELTPLFAQINTVEQDLRYAQMYRHAATGAKQKYYKNLGLAKTLLLIPTEKLNMLNSITAKIAGEEVPGDVNDETYNAFLASRKELDSDENQLKQAAISVDQLYKEGYKKTLDDYLKKNPSSLTDLGTKNIDEIRAYLNAYGSGGHQGDEEGAGGAPAGGVQPPPTPPTPPQPPAGGASAPRTRRTRRGQRRIDDFSPRPSASADADDESMEKIISDSIKRQNEMQERWGEQEKRPAPEPAPTPSAAAAEKKEPSPEEKQPSPIPTWLKEGIDAVKKGGTPMWTTNRLRNFLRDENVTDEEIGKMTPQENWLKAEEIIRRKEATFAPKSAAQTRSDIAPSSGKIEDEKTPEKPEAGIDADLVGKHYELQDDITTSHYQSSEKYGGLIKNLEKIVKDNKFSGLRIQEDALGKTNIGVPGLGIGQITKNGKKDFVLFERDRSKVNFGRDTLDNLKELYETDKNFAEKGVDAIVKHEKQHNEGLSRKLKEKGDQKIREAINKAKEENKEIDGASLAKIANDIRDKYYPKEEVMAEVQRKMDSYENPEQFIESEAEMHVAVDFALSGFNKMKNNQYGTEKGQYKPSDMHFNFVKPKLKEKIIKRMEEMRQDLVSKYEKKQPTETPAPAPSAAGSVETKQESDIKSERVRMQEEEAAEASFSDIAVTTKDLEIAKRRKENLEKRLANTNPENKEEIKALNNLIKSKKEEIETLEEQLSREKNKK